jgi:hypothetical protein
VIAERSMSQLPPVVHSAVAAEPAKAVPLQVTREPSPNAFKVGTDDTARALRDGIWIALICLPVAYAGLRLLTGRRRRRYLFR